MTLSRHNIIWKNWIYMQKYNISSAYITMFIPPLLKKQEIEECQILNFNHVHVG